MLGTPRMAAMDFAGKGLNARRGMFSPINAKNYGNGIGKITNYMIHHVSEVHTGTYQKLIL
jgi:hypothetical protein